MPFRNQWRDVQSLHRDGIPIDTSRDETAKLFDAALTQYTGWYNDSNYDGIDSTLVRLLASDPECVTSRILFTGLNLLGTAIPFKYMVETTIQSLGDIQSSNRYVNLHCQALLDCSRGHFSRACNTWEQCIVEYPFDMMAIKFVSDCYFYTGNRPMIRDSIARVLPIWEESRERPLQSYLYGMHAFGLGENNMIERSEKQALYGLELNPDDAWATHALAHALEYAGREHDGADFLKKTHQDWIKCDVIKPHIDWHWALYELEQGNHDFAEDILFNHILKKNSDLILLDFVDAAALIYRLKLAGQSQTKKYASARLKNFLNEHLHDHVLLFNDLHMYFLLDDEYYAENRDEFLRTLKETYENSDSDNANVYRDFARILFQAIDEFKTKNYAAVVNLVYPIRNEIYRIGGSNAQRDLFFLLLIHAAVHSDDRQHQSLARQLLNERCWLRNKTQSRMMENYTNALLHQ